MFVVFENKNRKELRHFTDVINVSVQQIHDELAYGITYRSSKSGELKFKGFPVRCWQLVNVNSKEV